MSSPLSVSSVSRPTGAERPRICTHPQSVASSGDDAADFAGKHGLVLDGWQRLALRVAMGERVGGRWSAGEVGLVVPRQNGKGSVLEARELYGLFVLGETIVHTAQLFKTSSDAFKRINGIVQRSPGLKRRVRKTLDSPIEKSIELFSGAKLWFLARGKNAGRGLTKFDMVIFDEAYDLSDAEMEALVPLMTTSRNPQIWYTSSAGLAHSMLLNSIRQRGITGAPTLAYMEWSIPQPNQGEPLPDLNDLELLAMANPGLWTRVTEEYLDIERGAFATNPRGLARERFGVFDEVVGASPPVFPEASWEATEDAGSALVGAPSFGVEVAQDRSWSCIGAAGRRPDGLVHVQVAENYPGTDWVPDKLVELGVDEVAIQPNSPAGSLILAIEAKGIRVQTLSGVDYAAACGHFYDLVKDGQLRHLAQGEVDTAVEGAEKRVTPEGAWVLERKGDVDISPLVAEVLAVHLASMDRVSVYEERGIRFL